jgi:CRISPR type III-A-associated RAMP protein Csm4
MPSGFLVKLRPTGPWRIGPDSGARESVDLVYHSDAVYSGVTHAMLRLGLLGDWLRDTAENAEGSAVRFSSCYPFHRNTLLVTPPRTHWPPPLSARLRYQGARFVPLSFVEGLLAEQPIQEDRWIIDGPSECLLPSGKAGVGGPFRVAHRSRIAVDRLEPGRVEHHSTACLEFAEGAGLWMAVAFSSDAAHEQWAKPVRAALKLLSDSGFGGERSSGWGRAEQPEISEGQMPGLIVNPPAAAEGGESAYWLLSLFTPSASDQVDWKRGSYSTVMRSGRVESPARSGEAKKRLPMVTEGSVLVASVEPRGAARNVAPEGFPHPVFRSGFALTISIPWRAAL